MKARRAECRRRRAHGGPARAVARAGAHRRTLPLQFKRVAGDSWCARPVFDPGNYNTHPSRVQRASGHGPLPSFPGRDAGLGGPDLRLWRQTAQPGHAARRSSRACRFRTTCRADAFAPLCSSHARTPSSRMDSLDVVHPSCHRPRVTPTSIGIHRWQRPCPTDLPRGQGCGDISLAHPQRGSPSDAHPWIPPM